MPSKNRSKNIKRGAKNVAIIAGRGALKSLTSAASTALISRGAPVGVTRTIEKKINKAIDRKLKTRGSGGYFQPPRFAGSGTYLPVMRQHTYGHRFLQSGTTQPSVRAESGVIMVSHSEYIGNILSPAVPNSFSNTLFPLNPGIASTFPWLATIAARFERYRFRQLVFEFTNALAVASTSGAMGQLGAVVVYNASKPVITDWTNFINYQGAVGSVVNSDLSMPVECASSSSAQRWFYVRTGALPNDQDIKTYDIGSFQLATNMLSAAALPAGTNLGMIRVHYTVELETPTLGPEIGSQIPEDAFSSNVVATGLAAAVPFGTNPVQSGQNLIGGILSHAANNVYTFPDNFIGTVYVTYYVRAGAAITGTITLGGSLAARVYLSANVGTSDGSISVAGAATWIQVRCIEVSPPTAPGGNTLTFTSSIAPTSSFLQIQMLNPSLGAPFASAGIPSNWTLVT